MVELLLGAVAGALAQIFTIPVSVIATRQQVGRPSVPGDDASLGKISVASDNSFLSVAREIIREDGITGLWLGIKPGLVLTANPAITYGMFERVRSLILLTKTKAGSNDKLTPGQSFLVGALSKTLATVVRVQFIITAITGSIYCFRLHIPISSQKCEFKLGAQTPKTKMTVFRRW